MLVNTQLVNTQLVNTQFADAKAKMEKALNETMESKLLPLNLQFFAGEDGGSGDDSGDDQGSGDDSGDDSGSGNEDGTDQGSKGDGDGAGSSKKGSKSFSQDDVNAIASKEAKKATEKLLKQLGVKDFKSAKDGLSKFKELTDAQKTDVDKAIEKAKELEETNGTLTTQLTTLNAQVAAMKADVNPDSLNDVIVLANNLTTDDVTIDDAIKQVLKKYPHFKRVGATTEPTKKPKFTDGDHKNEDKTPDVDKWTSAFKFQ